MTVDTLPFNALPFFLNTDEGERFCLYHEPEPGVQPRGTILYVPPFAEELNKSRRMVMLQARAYAQAGFGVLQIDLYGCGDSSGDIGKAHGEIWLKDLEQAWRWLDQRNLGPRHLWGLRLGGLLALHFAKRVNPASLILWQPALSGRAHLNQFARMQSAARLFSTGPSVEQNTEIGGYLMSPSLSKAIHELDAAKLTPGCPVQWLELNTRIQDAAEDYATAAGISHPALQPASALLITRWRDAGATVHTWSLHGDPFWSSAEIGIVPDLLAATAQAMESA